ncbi:MAG: MBL fold metallo-hydrolase [Pyrinomonadaceae bacterium]
MIQINSLKRFLIVAGFLICLSQAPSVRGAANTLDIYFIDTEGGAATLIVTPQGESLLVDSGNPGERDASRIARVARDVARLQQIDHYITTHWHSDHFGGIASLAALIPVKSYYDHGFLDPLPSDVDPTLMEAYRRVSQGKSVTLVPGAELKFARGKAAAPLSLRVLAAAGAVLGRPAAASAQIEPCGKDFAPKPEDTSDNARSIVFVLTYGEFKFFDAGDLTWNVENKLACPRNLPGAVDVYQVTHHGLDSSNNPALVGALRPRVAITNNGPRKGGAAATHATLRRHVAAADIYQLHRNVTTTEQENAPAANIANEAENCQGEYIKLSVDDKGRTYTVTVPSKKTTRTYKTR